MQKLMSEEPKWHQGGSVDFGTGLNFETQKMKFANKDKLMSSSGLIKMSVGNVPDSTVKGITFIYYYKAAFCVCVFVCLCILQNFVKSQRNLYIGASKASN